MRIAICVKQVPATSNIQIDPVTKRLKREKAAAILNPCDGYALELARRLKETYGGTITAFTMGPEQSRSVLKQCYALGADEAYLLCDGTFAGSDTYATAYILSQAIRKAEEKSGPFDLVLCGKQSSDGDTAQVGGELAEQLDLAQVTAVCDLPAMDGNAMIVLQERDSDLAEIRVRLPALLTIG